MKKFFTMVMMCMIMCSCSVSYFFGDVKLMNDNGDVIKKWDSAMIEKHSTDIIYGTQIAYSAVKANGGLNFFNEDGEPIYIRGGIVLVDNITMERNNKVISTDKIVRDMRKEYTNNKETITNYKEELKTIDKRKDSIAYNSKKAQIKTLEDVNFKLYKKALDKYRVELH